MGIILENSKAVFDELIGTNSFDDILKNSMRDQNMTIPILQM